MAQFSRLSKLFLVLASLPILSDQNIEEIIITGSLTKKSEQDSNPLQVITQKDYKNFNISNIGEIAKHIPSASGSHFQSNNLDGFDQGMSSFNMRGLGHSSTLILLNSKRHTFAGTPSSDGSSYIDLNIIPEIALKQIDLLKEGATSIYGSDAVAGVVNIKTETDFSGIKIQADHKKTSGYNQSDSSFGVLFGSSFKKLNYVFGVGVMDRKPLAASEVDGIAELAVSGLGRSFRVVESDIVEDGLWAGVYDAGQKIPDPECESNGGTLVNNETCGFNYGERFNLVNDENHEKIYTHIHYDLGLLDYEATFMFSNIKVNDNPQSPSYPALPFLSRKILPGQGGSPFNVPVTWYGRPLGPEYTSPKSPKDIKQYNFSQMISGQIDDNAELEISFTSSKHANMHFRPDIIDSRFVDALDGVKLNSSTGEDFFWDIFTPANNSNKLIDYVTGAEVSNKKSYLKSLEAVIRTNIVDINFAYGLQINKENLQIYYDEISEAKFDEKGQILKTADLFFLGGGINVSKSRKNYAAFFEAGKSLKNFSGRFSGRFEKFSNISSFDPKLSFKYKLIDGFYFRASIGSSFSMPSMAQMYSSDINLGSIRDINDNNPFVRQAKIGNPELKPASSVNKNIGFLFKNSSHQIAIDYWSLDFTDRVTGESAQALLDQNPFGESITRNENGDLIGVTTSYFNEENTKISGVDLSYKITLFKSQDHGILSANLEATSLEKFLTPSGIGSNTMINRIGKFNYDTHLYSLPKIRINTSLGLNVKNYDYRITARYIDGYNNGRAISTRGLQLGYGNKVASFLVFDFSIGNYFSFKNGVLNYKISASNIFNEPAPRVYDAPDFSFDSRTHDPRGRIIGLNFEYRK